MIRGGKHIPSRVMRVRRKCFLSLAPLTSPQSLTLALRTSSRRAVWDGRRLRLEARAASPSSPRDYTTVDDITVDSSALFLPLEITRTGTSLSGVLMPRRATLGR